MKFVANCEDETLQFSCSCDLEDLGLENVFIRHLTCNDHVEKLYYSLDHEAICVYRSEHIDMEPAEIPNYPQHAVCKDMPPVRN